ncbi:MAG: GatB/YqeY domain-containing protein [Candidatus Shapirobacteria bacterium]|nr:GatB/YqeY domain-containing protein [Candidatus Shapirobacteria bacterium]
MLKDKLKQKSVEALKAHDQKLVDVLRFLVSLIDKKELQLPAGKITEADEIAVLRKELKNKEESREMFEKAGRSDLVEQMDYEMEIVKSYLPAELSQGDIEKIIDEVIAEKGNNFGLIMKEVVLKTGGSVDGGVISGIVRKKMS